VSFGIGCTSDTVTRVIPVIHPNPVAAFTIIADTLCENKPVSFIAPANPALGSWNWDFGNGTGNAIPPFTRVYTTANSYTVRLVVRDTAGCGSLPVTDNITIFPRPVINAGPDKFFGPGTSATLDATISNPGNYDFLWTPAQFLNNATILNPVATPPATQTYTIRATDKVSKCFNTDMVIVTPVTNIYIPTAFTPNGDGNNDLWRIPGLALYPEARVTIYGRWGQQVYDAKDYVNHPWDGRYKGVPQDAGVYVYIITNAGPGGGNLKGTVMIIR
jgi:gliding motility-associated-like protein